MTNTSAVIALAGRRIDAAGATEPRFPASQIASVTGGIRAFLASAHATALVASAACGADLIGLQVAGEAGLRARVILPFEPSRFRATSVVDRGEDWGEIFDRVIRSLPAEDLVVLGLPENEDAYTRTNTEILDHARALAGNRLQVRALVVWNGTPRGPDDITAQFAETARARNFPVHEILTLPTGKS